MPSDYKIDRNKPSTCYLYTSPYQESFAMQNWQIGFFFKTMKVKNCKKICRCNLNETRTEKRMCKLSP